MRIDQQETLYSPEQAIINAAILQESDPDWEYRVTSGPLGTGMRKIEVYDQDDCYVGTM